jgi:hypothetical protein
LVACSLSHQDSPGAGSSSLRSVRSSGAPLVKAPNGDNPALAKDNDFLYYGSDDSHGFKCPIGAHIRRTNPRDSLDPEPGSARSIEIGKRHYRTHPLEEGATRKGFSREDLHGLWLPVLACHGHVGV